MAFAILAAVAAAAGLMLSEGTIHGSLPLLIAGGALSAVSPWGIVVAWLVIRYRRARR